MKTVWILAMTAAMSACGEAVPQQRAIDAMTSAGYSGITVTGQHGIAPEFAGCAKGDAVAFDVAATNAAGTPTTATVCCGLLIKACTIRH